MKKRPSTRNSLEKKKTTTKKKEPVDQGRTASLDGVFNLNETGSSLSLSLCVESVVFLGGCRCRIFLFYFMFFFVNPSPKKGGKEKPRRLPSPPAVTRRRRPAPSHLPPHPPRHPPPGGMFARRWRHRAAGRATRRRPQRHVDQPHTHTHTHAHKKKRPTFHRVFLARLRRSAFFGRRRRRRRERPASRYFSFFVLGFFWRGVCVCVCVALPMAARPTRSSREIHTHTHRHTHRQRTRERERERGASAAGRTRCKRDQSFGIHQWHPHGKVAVRTPTTSRPASVAEVDVDGHDVVGQGHVADRFRRNSPQRRRRRRSAPTQWRPRSSPAEAEQSTKKGKKNPTNRSWAPRLDGGVGVAAGVGSVGVCGFFFLRFVSRCLCRWLAGEHRLPTCKWHVPTGQWSTASRISRDCGGRPRRQAAPCHQRRTEMAAAAAAAAAATAVAALVLTLTAPAQPRQRRERRVGRRQRRQRRRRRRERGSRAQVWAVRHWTAAPGCVSTAATHTHTHTHTHGHSSGDTLARTHTHAHGHTHTDTDTDAEKTETADGGETRGRARWRQRHWAAKENTRRRRCVADDPASGWSQCGPSTDWPTGSSPQSRLPSAAGRNEQSAQRPRASHGRGTRRSAAVLVQLHAALARCSTRPGLGLAPPHGGGGGGGGWEPLWNRFGTASRAVDPPATRIAASGSVPAAAGAAAPPTAVAHWPPPAPHRLSPFRLLRCDRWPRRCRSPRSFSTTFRRPFFPCFVFRCSLALSLSLSLCRRRRLCPTTGRASPALASFAHISCRCCRCRCCRCRPAILALPAARPLVATLSRFLRYPFECMRETPRHLDVDRRPRKRRCATRCR